MLLNDFLSNLAAYPDDYTVFGSSFNDYQLLIIDMADRDAYSLDYNTGWSPYYFEHVSTSNDRLTVKEILDTYTTIRRYDNTIKNNSRVRLVYNTLKFDIIDETARHYPEVSIILPDVVDSNLLVPEIDITPYLKLDTPILPYKSRLPSFQPEDPNANIVKLSYTLTELVYLAVHGTLPDSYYVRYAEAVENAKRNKNLNKH